MIELLCVHAFVASSLLTGGAQVADVAMTQADLDGSLAWEEPQDRPPLFATLETETDQDSSDGDPQTAAARLEELESLVAPSSGPGRSTGVETTVTPRDHTSRSSRGPPPA